MTAPERVGSGRRRDTKSWLSSELKLYGSMFGVVVPIANKGNHSRNVISLDQGVAGHYEMAVDVIWRTLVFWGKSKQSSMGSMLQMEPSHGGCQRRRSTEL